MKTKSLTVEQRLKEIERYISRIKKRDKSIFKMLSKLSCKWEKRELLKAKLTAK